MHTTSSASLLLLCAVATAQQEVKAPSAPPPYVNPDVKTDRPTPQPAKAPFVGQRTQNTGEVGANKPRDADHTLAGQAPAPARLDPAAVLINDFGDGTIWGGSRSYKASFDGKAATYIPFFGSSAPRNYPLRMALRDASVGAQALRLRFADPAKVSGQHISIDHGALIETYDLSGSGMEQAFQFASLPGTGDLRLHIAVDTELALARRGDGFAFSNELGEVRYGAASVRDAGGSAVPIRSEFVDGAIELVVPAAYLATAVFPVTIDPLVATFTSTAALTIDFSPDVAYDVAQGVYLVVWEEAFSATDHDIASVMHDSAGTLISGTFAYLDRSTTYWARPRVADLRIPSRFLMAAERGVSPSRQIWGNTRSATGTFAVGAQFQIDTSGGSGDHFNCDVGGDPNPASPTYWTVVWERTFSATDSDIHAQQVALDSTLHGGLLLIDNSVATIDTHPGISKSDGNAPAFSQDWTIVFQRQFSATDEDIRYAQVHWDGVITTASASLDFSSRRDTNPVVSSPTDDLGGGRNWLAVYEGEVGPGTRDLIGTLGHGAAGVRATDLTTLENAFPARDQLEPHVDSDGCRFAVTYAEQFNGSDWDIFVSTFHVAYGTALGVSEGHVGLAQSTRPELRPRITAARSGGGGGGGATRYCAVFDDTLSGTDVDVRGALYNGESNGGFNILTTGCGVGMQTSGSTRLGDTATFTLTNVGGAPLMGLSLPFGPAPCGTCQIAIDLNGGVLFGTSVLPLALPCSGELVGVTLAVQGFTIGSGPCLGVARTSDTAHFTMR